MQSQRPRRELGLYLGLAFLISWAAWPLVLRDPQCSPLVPFGPLIAAVVTTLVFGGVRGPLGTYRNCCQTLRASDHPFRSSFSS